MSEAVLQAVDGGALSALMADFDDQGATAQLAAVDRKLVELAQEWAADRISREEWTAAREALEERRGNLQRRVESVRRARNLDGLPDPLRPAWATMPLHRRRAVIAALIDRVVIAPAVRGHNWFDADRISVVWKV